MSRRTLIILGFAFVVILMAIFLVSSRRQYELSKTLPDGTVISIRKVSYGKIHRVALGNKWERMAGSILPQNVVSRLGIPTFAVTNAVDTTVIFIETSATDTVNLRAGTRRFVSDGEGNESVLGIIGEIQLTSKSRIQAFALMWWNNRPAPQGLRIQLWDHTYRTNRVLTEFVVQDPTPWRESRWTAQPLPVTNHVDDLEVTLTKLNSYYHPPDYPFESDISILWTHMALSMRQSGPFARKWRVMNNMDIFDEFGHAMGASAPFTPVRMADGGSGASCDFDGGLSSTQIRRFRFQLNPASDLIFPSEEVATWRNVRVHEPGGDPFEPLSAQLPGYTFKIVDFRRERRTYSITPVTWKGFRCHVIVKYKADDDTEKTLVDEDVADESRSDDPFPKLPATVKYVDLTLAMVQSRYVEFYAHPDAATNAPIRR